MVSGLRLRRRPADDEIRLTIDAEVGAAQEKSYASIRWMSAALVGLMPGAMLMGLLIGVAIYRAVPGPIERLRALTKAMAQGAQVGPEQLSFNDEFSSLTKAFWEMVAASNAAEEQTSTLNASLEQLIEQRTRQLDQMNRSLERLNRDTRQIPRAVAAND